MPSSYQALRDKFMRCIINNEEYESDGIGEAETILISAGAHIYHGVITPPQSWNLNKNTRGDIEDALDFLCDEWDYTTEAN